MSEVTYEQWGSLFFDTAVTAERVVSGVNVLAGKPIDVGPMGVGPGRVVKVTARGTIGTATGERVADVPATFDVQLPVSLTFSIDLGIETHSFLADIQVPLRLTARACDDLKILLDLTPPTADQVQVRVKAKGLRASITQRAGNVEGELKRFVAKYVEREVAKDYVMAARTIDVRGAIDVAMTNLGPRDSGSTHLAEDLPVALEQEILTQGNLFAEEN